MRRSPDEAGATAGKERRRGRSSYPDRMNAVELPSAPIVGRNLVSGRFVRPEDAASIDVTSPYTGTVIGRVPATPARDVARAIDLAAKAQPDWAATPIKERSQRMFRLRALLERELDALATSAARESGKTLAEARAGVLKGIEVVEYALSIQNLDLGGVVEVSRGVTCEYRREPLGVVAGITPFNLAAMVPMWMFPIAVTLGNAFVWKPSEKVPLTACLLGELMVEAGIPDGVFTILHGGRETVEAIVDHEAIAAIGFVGSSPVARALYARGESRFGQGDITGPGGIELWTQVKKITRKWAAQTDANWMS